MDAIYLYQRHIYDMSRRFFLFGRDHMLRELRVPAGGSVLEIGCGTGRNLIAAARRYPDARLYGFDVSSVMLDTAHRALARAGLNSRIALAMADATDFSGAALFGQAAFDRVVISYALSMIPAWRDVLPAAHAALTPGGELHIVDFGRQAGWPAVARSALHAWLNRFSVEPRTGLEEELEDCAAAFGATLRFEALFGDYAIHAVLQRGPAG